MTLGAVRALAAWNRLVARVAEHLAGCKTHALARPPPLSLVAGRWGTSASPTGACHRDAQGRRRAVTRTQTRVVRSALGGWPDGHGAIGHGKGAAGERADTWQACGGERSLPGGTETTTALGVSAGAHGWERALDPPLSGVAHPRGLFHTITQLADHWVFGALPLEPSGDTAQAMRQATRQRKKAVLVEASGVDDGASATPMRERAEGFRQAGAERAPDAVANLLADFDKTFA